MRVPIKTHLKDLQGNSELTTDCKAVMGAKNTKPHHLGRWRGLGRSPCMVSSGFYFG